MGREETMLDHKELYPYLKQKSVEHLLGGVWNRPHLSLRERQVITLAANIVMCRPRGNHSHYQSAKQCSEVLEEAYPTG